MADATRAANAHSAALSSHEENTNMTTRNATESPLLQLPAEMRNEIYNGQIHEILLRPLLLESTFGVLLVCKQISEEAAMLQYSYCVFAFDHELAMRYFLLRCSPAQLKLIRTIQLKPRRCGLLKRSFWNFGNNGESIQLEKLEGLQTVVIEKSRVPSLRNAVDEQQDVGMLAETMKGMKPGVTVIIEE
ncbi:hypothetical protein J4E81_003419 [Alternaria sp. BMP 2799]|nr:hypothetical protein J4E81_003419 [Alternaria sp. BMP 2799]